FQAEDGIRDGHVTGVQTCALPISLDGTPGLGVATATPTGVRAALAGGRCSRGGGRGRVGGRPGLLQRAFGGPYARLRRLDRLARSEEHTSELQSRGHLVCRLLLEK